MKPNEQILYTTSCWKRHIDYPVLAHSMYCLLSSKRNYTKKTVYWFICENYSSGGSMLPSTDQFITDYVSITQYLTRRTFSPPG